MPGVPPDTMSQAKRALKGMFRKKSGRSEAQTSSSPPRDQTSPPSTADFTKTQTGVARPAAEPVSATPAGAASVGAVDTAAPNLDTRDETKLPDPASPSLADQVDQAGKTAAASVQHEKPVPDDTTPSTSTSLPAEQSDTASSTRPLTDSTAPRDIPKAEKNLDTGESTQPAAETARNASQTSLPQQTEHDASTGDRSSIMPPALHPQGATPPMSATSGPLEDNPILS